MPIDDIREFIPVRIAVLTVSDTRGPGEDKSGDTLVGRLPVAGHVLAARAIERDDLDAIIERLATWIADPDIHVILTTGGTGVTGRDVTPEAIEAVAEKMIPGFGELFRWQSYQTIGTSTLQSRERCGSRQAKAAKRSSMRALRIASRFAEAGQEAPPGLLAQRLAPPSASRGIAVVSRRRSRVRNVATNLSSASSRSAALA